MVLLLLTPEQRLHQLYVSTLLGHLKILNARKEELYNRDDQREFGSMSPIKRQVKDGLDKEAKHGTNLQVVGAFDDPVLEEANESGASGDVGIQLRASAVPTASALSLNLIRANDQASSD